MSYFRNTRMNMDKYYESVLNRYERGETKRSLGSLGFMYSYGDDCEVEKKEIKKEKKGKKRKEIKRKDKKKKKKNKLN